MDRGVERWQDSAERPSGASPERWARIWAHRPLLLTVARRRGARHEDAEDVADQAMLRAVEHPEISDERLRAWLVTVTSRLVVDEMRRQSTEAARWQRVAGRAEVSPGRHSPETVVTEQAEATWVAARADELLPPRQAEALRLTAEGHDIARVATELGVHYRAAESLLARARRTLRALLATAIGAATWIWHAPALLTSKPMSVALACTAVAMAIAVAPLVVLSPDHGEPAPAPPLPASSAPSPPGGPGRPASGPDPESGPVATSVPSAGPEPTGPPPEPTPLIPTSLLDPPELSPLRVPPALPKAGLPHAELPALPGRPTVRADPAPVLPLPRPLPPLVPTGTPAPVPPLPRP